MNLKEFVKSSLVEIIEGVAEAIESTKNSPGRAVINPALSHSNHANPKDINFDVAVTVNDDASLNGSAGIKALGLSIGGGADAATTNTAESRLSFSVPVAWPSVPKQQFNSNSRPTMAESD